MSNGIAVRNGETTSPKKDPSRRTLTPQMDVFENADEIFVLAGMPGALRDGIEFGWKMER